MDPLDLLLATFGPDAAIYAMAALMTVALSMLGFVGMNVVKARTEMRRRAGATAIPFGTEAVDKRHLRHGSLKRTKSVLDGVARNFGAANPVEMRVLRQRLGQAGLLDAHWVTWFVVGRIVAAVVLGLVAYVCLPMAMPRVTPTNLMLAGFGGFVLGYFGPNMVLSNRIKACQTEHRAGFPDFMDLMVVCADAGLAIESALDRVGREIAESYPSLAGNLHMATLEIRAGRTLAEALEHLGDRLGIEDARTFGTLIQQSEELGSSVTEALRVYSDEMRHKRLSRAEEKAYALPAKLVIPLGIFIFPILFVVILLPAAIRVMG